MITRAATAADLARARAVASQARAATARAARAAPTKVITTRRAAKITRAATAIVIFEVWVIRIVVAIALFVPNIDIIDVYFHRSSATRDSGVGLVTISINISDINVGTTSISHSSGGGSGRERNIVVVTVWSNRWRALLSVFCHGRYVYDGGGSKEMVADGRRWSRYCCCRTIVVPNLTLKILVPTLKKLR